jgi:hypothetical protein
MYIQYTSKNSLLFSPRQRRQLLTFVIKSVCNLVTYHNTDTTIVQRFGEMLAVEKRLKDSGWEY